MTEVNEKKMRKDLAEIYEDFLRNPNDSSVHSRAIAYDRKYGGLSAYSNILVKKPISQDIEKALNGLFKLYQYGNGTFDDNETVKLAKKTLEDLKKIRER